MSHLSKKIVTTMSCIAMAMLPLENANAKTINTKDYALYQDTSYQLGDGASLIETEQGTTLFISSYGKFTVKNSDHTFILYSRSTKDPVAFIDSNTPLRINPGSYIIQDSHSGNDFNAIKENLIYTKDSENCEREYNNTANYATTISLGKQYIGNLSATIQEKDVDFYRFSLDAGSSISGELNLTDNKDATMEIYQEINNDIYKVAETSGNDSTKYFNNVKLGKGNYCAKIYNSKGDPVKEYTFKLEGAVEKNEYSTYEIEDNDTVPRSTAIGEGVACKGKLSGPKDVDYYYIPSRENNNVKVTFTCPSETSPQVYRIDVSYLDARNSQTHLTTFYSNSSGCSQSNVVPIRNGNCIVKVSCTNSSWAPSSEYSVKVDYNKNQQVTFIDLSKNKVDYVVGENKQLVADVFPIDATNKNLVWSSSNSNVATVSSNGWLSCKSSGTVCITVRAADGSPFVAQLYINVKATVTPTPTPVANFTIICDDDESFYEGDTISLDISNNQIDSSKIRWSSSNTYVARVNNYGEVDFLKSGTVTIRATNTSNNTYAERTFYVKKEASNDNTLRRVKTSKGKCTKTGSTKYTITLNRNQKYTKITPVTNDADATYTIDGLRIKTKQVYVNRWSQKTIKVKVTAANGDIKTYKIVIKRK